jgi:hypothetical protein
MDIYRLTDDLIDLFATHPEFAMALQFGSTPDGQVVLVIAGRIAITIDDYPFEPIEGFPINPQPTPFDSLVRARAVEAWVSQLPLTPRTIRPIDPYNDDFRRRLKDFWKKRGYDYDPTSGPHHHIPFKTITQLDAVFYRWEPLPTSIKVLQGSQKITAGTFAAPYSEAPFVPTGFAAVARYALPQPFPACWRWELQPQPTTIRCGAAIPQHWQSGGGVEVQFLTDVDNRGPIANPVEIPAM